jgi:methionyl-tRNA formyltransferase
MRFAITAIDMYCGVFEALLEAGWEPVKLFTFPVDDIHTHNRIVIAKAVHELKIPIQYSPMQEADLQDLAARGCDVIVGAGYQWRIPDWRPHLRYGINFHPSPLPDGRGPYPFVNALLEGRPAWGVSCHQFDRDFDTGAILDQENFPLDAAECLESLIMKSQLALMRLAARVAADLPGLWQAARPQQGGSYFKRWTEAQRTVDLTRPVDEIMRQLRAFGLLEAIVRVGEMSLFVRRAVGWQEAHAHAPGSLVSNNNRQIILAVPGGYIGLLEWSALSPEVMREIGR